MLPQLARVKGIALDLLFPRWCVGCGREGEFICASCSRSLARIMPPICPRCGRPQASGVICPGCVGGRQAAIDGIRAPFRFEGVMRQAIHQLKYRNLRALAGPLAELLHHYLTENPLPAEVLVPVPLHNRRLRERGFNQARLLARALSRPTGLPVVDGCLIRKREAPPQARAGTVAERRRNVADVFFCRNQQLKDRTVLLIDDVATSGATLDACARAARAGGASAVWGVALAREI